MFTEAPIVDTRADVLRLLSFALLRARPEACADPHVLGLFEHRPPHRDEPRARTLLAALEVHPHARQDPYLLNTANRLRSLELLDTFLSTREMQPDKSVVLAAHRIYEWDEGIAHLLAWGHAHGATANVLELATALKPLHARHRSPQDLLHTLERLVAPRSLDQHEPNWPILEQIGVNTLRHVPPAMQIAFLEHVQRLYPDHAVAIGLTLLELNRYDDRTPELGSRFEHLLKQAKHQDSILALSLERDTSEFWHLATTSGALEHLLHTTSQRDLSRLTWIGARARGFGLPPHFWRPIIRHVFDHATSASLRFQAACEFGDRELLEQLHQAAPDDLGPRAALDLLDSLERLRKIGKPRRAIVRLDGTRVGLLTELPSNTGTRFAYDRDYLATPNALPLAPNLPLRPEPYDAPGLHPVFAGLLPQGWLLDIDLRKYDLKPGDDFGLLLATGRDTIGAIEILPE